jgi:hypothetical protein
MTVPEVAAEMVAIPEVAPLRVIEAKPEEFVVAVDEDNVGVTYPDVENVTTLFAIGLS